MRHLLDALINSPAHYTIRHHFNNLWTLVFVLGILFAELVIVYVIVRAVVAIAKNTPAGFRFMVRKFDIGEKEIPQAFLELTFPADTSKSAFATEQLHIILSSTVKYYDFWDRLAARKKPYSLELVGTQDEGIRYILRVPVSELDAFQHNLLSFMPGLKVKQVDDYMISVAGTTVGILELRLSADFVLPLKDHKALEEHDLIAYLTGHMTKLRADELIAFQIVATPIFNSTHHRVLRKINTTRGRIASGKEVSSKLEVQRTALGYILWLLWYPPLWFIAAMSKLVTWLGEMLLGILSKEDVSPTSGNAYSTSNPYEQELGQIIKTKIDQHLFEVTMRVLESSPTQSKLAPLLNSFAPFTSNHQSIDWRRDIPFLSRDDKHLAMFRERVLSPHHLSQQTILSSSELSDLYHFPNTALTKTEGFVKSRSRELAAPLSIKQSSASLDVVVGVNEHGGDYQAIGMTLEQRQKHTYVIGKTGTGKTTLLTNSIYQDVLTGKGLAVFDPHGDMFQELLGIIPESRHEDVVIFDPSDRDWPIGLNILDPGIEFRSEDDKQEGITSMVLSVFKKLADDNQWGPRMEHILRNTTLTALQVPNPNLYTLQRLLTDKKYQRTVAKTLKDPVLKQFWDKEFKLLGTMQMSTVTAPLTHRLGHFITTKRSRHILLQGKSTIRIADIMNEGKILLVNLSKGDIGEDQSLFFGTILTSFIWMAAYQRTNIPEKQRRDFFVYVDEFQNFATPQFAEITSEGRKYHLPLIVSHQNIAQIEDNNIVKIVASNASTLICFKVGPEDEAFILPYMKPEVESGDIVNLAPYHFYMKTTSGVSEDAFSGITVPLDVTESDTTRDVVVAASRQRYATPVKTVEKQMEKLFELGMKSTKKGVVAMIGAEPQVKSRKPQPKPDTKKLEKTHEG